MPKRKTARKVRTCTLEKMCKGAMEISFVGDPDAVGLNVVDRININTYVKTKGQLYRFPRKHDLKGRIWLNFCPWCGADIRSRLEQERGAKG